jgi:hypothetical protein
MLAFYPLPPRPQVSLKDALHPILIVTAALIALGILGTFPTFFEAFAPE